MKQALDFVKTFTLPQAAIVLGLIAGGVAIAYRLPEDALVETVGTIVALGIGGTLLTSRRKTPERVSEPPPPPPPRRNTRDGSVDVWDLVAWAVFGLGLLAALGRAGVLR